MQLLLQLLLIGPVRQYGEEISRELSAEYLIGNFFQQEPCTPEKQTKCQSGLKPTAQMSLNASELAVNDMDGMPPETYPPST